MPHFPELPHPLGVYMLNRLLLQREGSELYAASQSHVEREVVLELLLPSDARAEAEAAFVAMGRARVAAARLPHVGQVYESLCVEGYWFLTQELPLGTSVAAVMQQGKKLPIVRCAEIIVAVSEIYAHCAAAGYAVLPPEPESIFMNEEICCLSPVVAGRFDESSAPVHQQALADIISRLAPTSGAGSTRLGKLLTWLREGYEGRRLRWNEVAQTARPFVEQLCVAPEIHPAEGPAAQRRRRVREYHRMGQVAACVGLGLLLMGGIASLGILFRSGVTLHHEAISAEGIACQAGEGVCLVSAAPVTVAQYREFLNSRSGSGDWRPSQWDTQLLLPAEPVVGVTLAQARAYADFRGAVLPTLPQLQTAFRAGAQHPLKEWSADSFQGQGYGLISIGSPLAISPSAPFTPIPMPSDPAYADDKLGFRLAYPKNMTE